MYYINITPNERVKVFKALNISLSHCEQCDMNVCGPVCEFSHDIDIQKSKLPSDEIWVYTLFMHRGGMRYGELIEHTMPLSFELGIIIIHALY